MFPTSNLTPQRQLEKIFRLPFLLKNQFHAQIVMLPYFFNNTFLQTRL